MTDYMDECRCLPQSLHEILKKSVDSLKDIQLAGVSSKIEERNKIVDDLVSSMERMGTSVDKAKILAGLPILPEEKMFNDLDRFLEACRCKEGVDFKWDEFPYHITGLKVGSVGDRRTKTEKLATLPPSMIADRQHLETVSAKVYDWYVDRGGMKELCEKHPGEALSWEDIRKEAIAADIVSKDDMDKFLRVNKEVAKTAGYDYAVALSNILYRIRKEEGCPIKPGRFGKG